jgi:hypothetical protein
MRIEEVDPRDLVPHHLAYDAYRVYSMEKILTNGTALPPIPVFEIPPDKLLECGTMPRVYGTHIVYNGHHRRMAYIGAGELARIVVIESDRDIAQLLDDERFAYVDGNNFEDHLDAVFAIVNIALPMLTRRDLETQADFFGKPENL